MTSEQRKAIIQALIEKDVNGLKAAKGEVVIIRNFFDHLKFTSTIGRKDEDFSKIIFAPGPYRDLLEKLNKDKEGQLTPNPIWWVPADGLTDEEIQAYKEQQDKKQHKPT
jgi:hypothetical protein